MSGSHARRADPRRADPELIGTRHLVRLILRRDRIRLPIWLGGLVAVTAATANAVIGLYDTPQERAGYAATVEDSAITRLMAGIPRDVDTIGGILSYELTALTGIVVSLLVVFLVIRHTRAEEESGNAELVRSAAVGRHAPIAATLIVALGASLAAGGLEAAVLVGSGVDAGPALLFGAGLTGLGLVFTSIAIAAAQVTASARGALAIAGGIVAVCYVIRGVAAVDESFATWLSPFGWQDEIRPFGDEARVSPLLLMLALSAAGLALASWLAGRRDFAAGLLPGRPGNPRASRRLGTAVGLAVRQQRGLIIGWLIGLALTAFVFGAFGREMQTMVESNPDIAAILIGQADDVTRGYFGYVMNFLGVTASGFAIASALRLRQAEESGQAENVLATAVSRTSWAVSGLAVTATGTVALVLVLSVVASASHVATSGDSSLLWPIIGAGLATIPAVFVLVGLTVALHGWAPRWTLLAWAPLAWAVVQAYLGELLRLPESVAGLSPFQHLPLLPLDEFVVTPVLLLAVLALALMAAGVLGLRRRDLVPG